MKSLLFKLYVKCSRLVSRIAFRCIFFGFFRNNSRITFAFNSESVRDGFGAQFHRICSIVHTAELIRSQVIRPKIEHVTIHPLDSFHNLEEMYKFLAPLNRELFQSKRFRDSALSPFDEKDIIWLTSLSMRTLVKIRLSSFLKKRNVLIICHDAHSIADIFTEDYGPNLSLFFDFSLDANQVDMADVVIHFRQGHGGFSVYPGQKIPRELSIQYFDFCLSKILSEKVNLHRSLTIFTDAPRENVMFAPPSEQEKLWDGMPGFDGKILTHLGRDLESHFKEKYSDKFNSIKIDRITDPFIMFKIMTQANFLIISRSSLSYISAILNKNGKIFSPPDFWHPSPKKWIKIKRRNFGS